MTVCKIFSLNYIPIWICIALDRCVLSFFDKIHCSFLICLFVILRSSKRTCRLSANVTVSPDPVRHRSAGMPCPSYAKSARPFWNLTSRLTTWCTRNGASSCVPFRSGTETLPKRTSCISPRPPTTASPTSGTGRWGRTDGGATKLAPVWTGAGSCVVGVAIKLC